MKEKLEEAKGLMTDVLNLIETEIYFIGLGDSKKERDMQFLSELIIYSIESMEEIKDA